MPRPQGRILHYTLYNNHYSFKITRPGLEPEMRASKARVLPITPPGKKPYSGRKFISKHQKQCTKKGKNSPDSTNIAQELEIKAARGVRTSAN